MSILDKEARIGKFTSSEIWKLLTVGTDRKSFGEKALTYIQEKKYESRVGRPLSIERTGRPALWGHYLQERVHELLGSSYELIEDKTIQHPSIEYWCGTPDCKKSMDSVVGDIKCYEPKKFCSYVDALLRGKKIENTEGLKKSYPQEWWQLVSNAILLNTKHVEAIVYMPYFSELQAIRESVDMLESEDDQRKYAFIKNAHYNELAYLQDDRYYKNLNVVRFEVPESDKHLLTEKVLAAGKLLEK